MSRKTRDVTEQEWREWDWIDVTQIGDRGRVYLRGKSKIPPRPQDGYMYEQTVDAYGNPGWTRVQVLAESDRDDVVDRSAFRSVIIGDSRKGGLR